MFGKTLEDNHLTGLMNSLNLKVQSMAGMRMARSTWTDEFESAGGEVDMSVRDGMPKLPLPRYLHEHREEILHIFDDSFGPDYNPEGWREYLHNNPVVAADLDIIVQKCPVRISRKDVCAFARDARSGTYPDIRRLFLACMIWGYNRDRNGPPNTERALSDPRAEEVLKRTVRRISSGQIKGAYDDFHLAKCGPAFFPKFFYFVGKEWQTRPLPLVLDRHVARFLHFLGEQEGWQSQLFAKVGRRGYVRRYPEGYLRYICAMDEWATELGCSSDNVEYFMYLKGKDRAGYSTKPKEVHMANKIKASQIDDQYIGAARDFCRACGLEKELDKIEDMDWPPTWHLSKKDPTSPNSRTERQFQHAVRGSFEAMFKKKGIRERPVIQQPRSGGTEIWKAAPRWEERFREYLGTPEGSNWKERYNPSWVPPARPEPLEHPTTPGIPLPVPITLSAAQYAEFKNLADGFGEKPEVVAKIWILERLRQLR